MIPSNVERLLARLFEPKKCDGWWEYQAIYEPVARIARLLREEGIDIPIGMWLDWMPLIKGENYYPHIMRLGMGSLDLAEVDRQFAAWRGTHLHPPEIVDLTEQDERMSQAELDELHPGFDEQARELREAQERPRRKHEPRT